MFHLFFMAQNVASILIFPFCWLYIYPYVSFWFHREVFCGYSTISFRGQAATDSRSSITPATTPGSLFNSLRYFFFNAVYTKNVIAFDRRYRRMATALHGKIKVPAAREWKIAHSQIHKSMRDQVAVLFDFNRGRWRFLYFSSCFIKTNLPSSSPQ